MLVASHIAICMGELPWNCVHIKVKNNLYKITNRNFSGFHRVPLFPGRLGFWKRWFLWREGYRSPLRKTLVAGKRKNAKLNPHTTSTPEIEPEPHWPEASALITVLSLLHDTFYLYILKKGNPFLSSVFHSTRYGSEINYYVYIIGCYR